MKAYRIGEMAAVFVIIFALMSSFVITSFAVTPAISLTQGGKGNAIKSLSFLSNTPAGSGIVVVEWLGTVPNPCNYIATPNDTAGDTFNSFACVQDGNSGAIRGYYVNSSAGSATNTINCRWAANNTHVVSCYVFTISNPGTITEPQTNIGLGTLISTTAFEPTFNSLLIAAAGIQTFCQSVNVGSSYVAFSPANECYSTPYGLSGESTLWQFPVGVSTTAPMAISNSAVWSEIVIQITSPAGGTTTTTSGSTTTTSCASGTTCTVTSTVIGWNMPNGVTFGNGIVAFLLMMVTTGAFAGIPLTLNYKGDFIVTMAFIGMTAGSLLGMLTLTSTPSTSVPFALVLVSALYLVLWLWKGRA